MFTAEEAGGSDGEPKPVRVVRDLEEKVLGWTAAGIKSSEKENAKRMRGGSAAKTNFQNVKEASDGGVLGLNIEGLH